MGCRSDQPATGVGCIAGFPGPDEREPSDALKRCGRVTLTDVARLSEKSLWRNDLYRRSSSSISSVLARPLCCSGRASCRSCVDRPRRRLLVRRYCEGAEQDELLVDRYSLTTEPSDSAIVLGVHPGKSAPRPISVSLAAHRSLWRSPELTGGKRVTGAECRWGKCAATLGLARSEEKPAIDWT